MIVAGRSLVRGDLHGAVNYRSVFIRASAANSSNLDSTRISKQIFAAKRIPFKQTHEQAPI